MENSLIYTLITAALGGVASIWSYWTGRRKRASDNAKGKAEALKELNDIIDQQSTRINDLYEVVLTLKSENYKLSTQNEKLLSNQKELLKEISDLRAALGKEEKTGEPLKEAAPRPRKKTEKK